MSVTDQSEPKNDDEAEVGTIVDHTAISEHIPEPAVVDPTPEPATPEPAIPEPAALPSRKSLRDFVRDIDDIERKTVHVDIWDVDVEVRSMDAKTRAEMVNRAAAKAEDGTPDESVASAFYERVYVDLVIHCTYDPATGQRAFDEGDREMLMSKAAVAVEQIAMAAMVISGLGAKAVDDAAGNSSSVTPSGGSTSPSPSA